MPIRDNTSLEKVLSKCPQNLESSSHEMRTIGFPLEGSKGFSHFGSPLPKDFSTEMLKIEATQKSSGHYPGTLSITEVHWSPLSGHWQVQKNEVQWTPNLRWKLIIHGP